MKNLLFLLALLAGTAFCGPTAHAQCALAANASQAAVTSAASTANSGACPGPLTHEVLFAPGSTNWTSAVYLPCGNVSYMGPSIANFANPTAYINASTVGASANPWNFSGCTGVTIQNLGFTGSGGPYFNGTNHSNITLLNNTIINVPDSGNPAQACCAGPNAIEFDGAETTPVVGSGTSAYVGNLVQNVNVEFNTIGNSGSCPTSWNPNGPGEINSACTAIWIATGTMRNATFNHNFISYMNEGIKPNGGVTGNCATCVSRVGDNVQIEYNFLHNIHRIAVEAQWQVVNSPFIVSHNVDLIDDVGTLNGWPTAYFGTLTMSLPCCGNGFYNALYYSGETACMGTGAPCPAMQVEDNVVMSTSVAGGYQYHVAPYAFEYWGSGTQGLYNLVEGYFSNGFEYNTNYGPGNVTAAAVSWNKICKPTDYTSANGWTGYIVNEQVNPNEVPPAQVGNVTANGCTTDQSIAPVISPAAGNQAFPLTVTMTVPVTLQAGYNTGQNTSIYYTTDGSTPTVNSTRLIGSTITLNNPGTVKAIGMWGQPPQPTSYPAGYGYVPSNVISAVYTSGGIPTAAVPVLTPGTESFLGTISVSAASTTPSAVLRCTTDGSTPNASSPIYTGAFSVSSTTTIGCIATATGYNNSGVGTGVYTLESTAAAPVFSPGTETYVNSVSVSVTDTTSGATVYCTTNGTTPTTSSTVYSGAFTFTATTTLKCFAVETGFGNSAVTTGVYTLSTLPQVAMPALNPTSLIFTGTQVVSVTDATAGSTIYCTTDGSTPATSSPAYTGAFTFSATTNLQCIATASGFSQSATASGTFTLGSSAGQAFGNSANNVAGGTYVNTFNSIYSITPPGTWTTNQATLNFGTSGTVTSGSKTDIVLVQATSPTTEATSALCHATYTQTSATPPGSVTLAVSGCGTLSGAYWVNTETNDPLGPSPFGEWNCGSACNGTVPTSGNGTYYGWFAANPYGSYTGLPTTLLQGGAQATVYFTLNPAIASGTLGNTGSVTTLNVAAPAIQFTAYPAYANGTTGSLPDSYGNTASWSSSNTAILNVGGTGLVSCAAAGSANVQVTAQPSGVVFTPWTITCATPPPPPMLTSVSLGTTGGVTSIAYGATNQVIATCNYSDGSTTNCTTTDSRGNAASGWTSSSTQYATVSTSGLASAVAIGSTTLSASAGGKAATAIPLSVVSQQTLTGATLGNAGNINTINPGGTIQFHAYCAYAGGITTQDCSVTDIYGDGVTSWGSSNTTVMSMSTGGLATGKIAGSANATAVVNGVVNATPYAVTVVNSAPVLNGVTLSTTSGVTGLFVGSTNQLLATCTYSDGSKTNCNNSDTYGNVAGTWTSTAPWHATVSGSGVASGVGAGTTTFTAHAGSFTSPALPLTILAVPTGVYQITITGPVRFSGTIAF
ncbi:MAG: chitobiase/beta-hexosaminidase C-terminal domain-containing protein [Acidobacteriaceae bacterium]